MYLNSTNIQHEKLLFQLIKPYLKWFSLDNVEDQKISKNEEEMEVEGIEDSQDQKKSRKRKKKDKEDIKKNSKK